MSESSAEDRRLGLDRGITRRDFLNGVPLVVGASILDASWPASLLAAEFAPEKSPGYYPPALTGLRGSHAGSFEAAHEHLKDRGGFDPALAADTGESYDLVVVGGGISGLAASFFYRRQHGASARILVLDNHDDLGGHAKRNEFRHGGRLLIGYGGTQSIDGPGSYSPEAAGLLRDVGIDVQRFHSAFDSRLYESLGLTRGVFFDKETFGEDRLVAGAGTLPWPEFLARTPLAAEAQRDIARVYDDRTDPWPGVTVEEKKARLRRMSYVAFLKDVLKLHPAAVSFFRHQGIGFWGVSSDAVPALDYWQWGYPGFDGLGLPGDTGRSEPYIFHFPDGNASVARLLVRALIPEALPGSDMEDVVTAHLDYGRLDDGGRPVRIRLNSTAVNVRHDGPPEPGSGVSVAYVRGGRAYRVRGRRCILACYNSLIPVLCPELPEAQKQALRYATRAPLVYTNVLIRSWVAFQKLGVQRVHAPGGYHADFTLDFPVSLGGYRCPRSPEEPMVVHMVRVPTSPGLPVREQCQSGRHELLATSFEDFERRIRDQLGRSLAGGGFDPPRDIEAITVNRWPHGYAYEPNSLFDPEWAEGEQPWVVGRRRFGAIAIANSDAGASAYTDVAIDQAFRAVGEITRSGRAAVR
ncbi:MAG TPA: FAD/NAD(P)-binding protein [Vicinamibacteria bacterium]|nr:FAD/NAD(P)-binding protein [Vicinamibacteria bacterium]